MTHFEAAFMIGYMVKGDLENQGLVFGREDAQPLLFKTEEEAFKACAPFDKSHPDFKHIVLALVEVQNGKN